MAERRDEKAEINPAARHDPPGAPEPAEPPRTPDHQVRAKQSGELNPLDPGGIGN